MSLIAGSVVSLVGGSAPPLAGPVPSEVEEKHMNEQFKPGDTVIWWKRIPGGNYVYPVKATVVDVTAKRVKIEADDDGRMVIRYVKPQSLQQHN